MSDISAVREKRLELEKLEKAKDFWGPESYEAMRQALQDDLDELLGASSSLTVKLPVRPIHLSSPIKPKAAVVELVADPHPTEVLPAMPVEKKPMVKTSPMAALPVPFIEGAPMIEHLTTQAPSDAYDWAKRYFNAGGFRIIGSESTSCCWHILTLGQFCILSLPKKRGHA